MGSTGSKSLSEFSKEEIAEYLSLYGDNYLQYAERIKQNCVDGELLVSLNEEELYETLDELEVTSQLHRKKLLNEMKRFIPGLMGPSSSPSNQRNISSDQCIADALSVKFASQSLENISLRHNVKMLQSTRRRNVGPPEGTATLVSTDIKNSTDLWEHDEYAMKHALALHDQILRGARAKHHGYEVDTEVRKIVAEGS